MSLPIKYEDHPKAKPGDPCSLCGSVTEAPVIDHCHRHGWVRGVLCRSCNGVMMVVDLRITPRSESLKIEMLTAHAGNCIECPKLSVSDLDPTRPLRSDEWLLQERRSIGDRIRLRRLHENMTQENAAAASLVSRSVYQAVEAGSTDARISTLLRIARVLGVHVTDLLGD